MSRIPKRNRDLLHHVLGRAALRIGGWAAWIVGFWMGAQSYNQNHQTYAESRLMLGWKLWLWMAIGAVSGFLLFRLWRCFTQRPVRGIVERYSTTRGYGSGESPDGRESDSDFRINTVLRVRTERGKRRRLVFEQKHGFYLYYHEGNRIEKLGGLTYPINLDPDAESGRVCSVCGAFSSKDSTVCPSCRHSLIDPEDL